MIRRLQDSDDGFSLHLPRCTNLLDTADVLTDLTLRLQQAEGLARVCAAAMLDQTLEEDDLRHALGLLHLYLRLLRQGLARWQVSPFETRHNQAAGAGEERGHDL